MSEELNKLEKVKMPIGTTGISFGGGYNTFYVFNDISTNSYAKIQNNFVSVTPPPNSTTFAKNGFCINNNIIYQYGGSNSTNSDTNTLYSYNPFSNTWTTLTPNVSINSMGFVSMPLYNKLYSIGGYQTVGANSLGTATNGVYEYDIINNIWNTKNNMPDSVTGSCVVNNNVIYRLVGLDGSPSNLLYAYYPIEDIWINLANHPNSDGLEAVQAVVYANKIWCCGGQDGNTGQPVATCNVYDIATNIWSSFTSMPEVTSGYNAVVLNNKMYIIGGDTTGITATNNIYSYSFENSIWTKEPLSLVNNLSINLGNGVVGPEPVGLGGA